MSSLRDRPTPDLIVMFLAGLVAALLLGSMVGVIILEFTGHHEDIDALAARLADITNTMIGAIVGYLAGRGVIPPGAVGDVSLTGPDS